MSLCRKFRWDYMIVLKDDSLSSVWDEFEGLKKLNEYNQYNHSWRGRSQYFEAVNGIEYSYGSPEKRIEIHVVVCIEREPFVNSDDEVDVRSCKHAWISSQPLTESNLHLRCNLCARGRWQIEESFLDEKHRGYTYEHAYTHNWNGMKAFHFLMRLGHLLNVLALASEGIATFVDLLGIKGFFHNLVSTMAATPFEPYRKRLDERMARKRQLRLVA